MFEFLGRGHSKAGGSQADPGPSTLPQTVQMGATQRDMARLTLQHVLKEHGIPAHWIGGEIIPIHVPGQGEAVLLQLEVAHWDDALVMHLPALQQELLIGLRRFDPTADNSRYRFTWKFSPDCECPHTKLPAPDFWGPSAGNDPVAEPETDDQGFAPTQIHDRR